MNDAGKFPVWNETLDIKLPAGNNDSEILKISCFDEDLIMDSNVGEAEFSVRDLLGDTKWISVFHQGKKAADIQISAKLVNELKKQDTDVINEFIEQEEGINKNNRIPTSLVTT